MTGVRDEYAAHPGGAEGWYANGGGDVYRNPHTDAVHAMVGLAAERWPDLFSADERMLDLCTGSGEVVRALMNNEVRESLIDASDPFTSIAFEREQGRALTARWTFADVASGALNDRSWGTAWCSFALHLCEQSWLPLVVHQLAQAAKHLVIITPHKRPELDPRWGFELGDEHRDLKWRVRLRRYDRNFREFQLSE